MVCFCVEKMRIYRLLARRKFYLSWFVFLTSFTIYTEIYLYYINTFSWNKLKCKNEEDCMKILLVADPQIIGDFKEAKKVTPFSIFDSDRYLKKTYLHANNFVKPDVIIFLGDLMDEGSVATDREFYNYAQRVFNIFYGETEHVKHIWLPGDNDIGGEDFDVRPRKLRRFEKVFSQPELISSKNVTFFKVNRMTLTVPVYKKQRDFYDSSKIFIGLSHIPLMFMPSVFVEKVITKMLPHVIFTAHEHKSMIVTTDALLREDFHVIPVKPTENKIFEYVLGVTDMYEILIPTCSYRMGTKNIGFGYAQIGSSKLNMENLIQVSMDGPNVNIKFLRLLKEYLNEDNKLIDLGTCGLHVVHGSIQTGHKAAGWNLHSFLYGIYWLFKDSPSRRSDFTGITNSNVFPLKFCHTRWVEGSKAANRALMIYKDLKKYVENPSIIFPHTTSSKNVKNGLKDPLLPTKIAFFSTICSDMEPFLTKFQSNEPLAPFLFNELYILLNCLLQKFIKKTTIPKDSSDLYKINFKSKDIFLAYDKINIGFRASKLLNEVKVPEKEKLLFLQECQKFLISTVSKILERCGLNHRMVKGLSCLDPNIISSSKTIAEKRMQTCLEILNDKNIISGEIAENAKKQFNAMISLKEDLFKSYKKQRLDHFYEDLCRENYADLLKVIRILLIFSNGNAAVESGFSFNKQMLIENLKDNSLIAQRTIYDNIVLCGGAENIIVTDNMIKLYKQANQKYKEYLEKERTEEREKNARQGEKRKIEMEIKELELKKLKLDLLKKTELESIETRIKLLKKNL